MLVLRDCAEAAPLRVVTASDAAIAATHWMRNFIRESPLPSNAGCSQALRAAYESIMRAMDQPVGVVSIAARITPPPDR